jgi:lipoyl synthase
MQLSKEALWHASKQELVDLLNTGVFTAKPKTVYFYAPSFMYYKTSYYHSSQFHFPTVSVTGTSCALDCKHCGGKVLETMQPAETPEKLLAVAAKMKRYGSSGCLISGGCMPNGAIPLRKFISTIGKIKRKLGLTVLVHTGIIDLDTAVALRDAGVDAALTDIIGSDETVKKVYNLNVTINDYASSLKALQEAGLNFVPHVIVGLHEGKLKGELDALNIISSVKPSALVVIGFMPILGTSMAKVKPPQPADIAKVAAIARLMFPRTPLALGCMRPKGKNRAETDVLSLKAGVDAIAFPSEEVIKYAEAQRYKFGFSSCCCAQIHVDADFRSPSK